MLVAAALLAVGCAKTFNGQATQPNPLGYPNEMLRESAEIAIVTGDKDLFAPRANTSVIGLGTTVLVQERYPLLNKASFTVVTRDRLRFHIQLEHKWKEYVDVRGWYAYLIDDQGRRYEPVDIDHSRDRHVVVVWDYDTIQRDGRTRPQTLGSLSVFRGFGDFVFYSKDIFSEDIRRLTFVIERSGVRFRFTWRFTDEQLETLDDSVAAR